MSIDNLHVLYDEFWEDILLDAQTTGELQATAFFEKYAAIAAENGDCGDLERSHARKEGSNGYQIDGYDLDRERREFVLVVSDFRSGTELQSLNLSTLGILFRRGERFFENSLRSEFISQLEETSDAFQVAHLIYTNANFIRRVRIIVFSNARLVARKRQIESKQVGGIIFNFSALDFSRYYDIIESKTGSEPIDIDIEELNGGAIPYIKAFSGGEEYESYLIALPGKLVAEIYSRYGARLLEQNVRTFLQARTKVNRGIINTINDRPDMFFAYNNGLTATATEVKLKPLPSGGLGLSEVTNLQIVNGGQTTASILYARDRNNSDLSSVYVQMKLSVVKTNMIEDVVQKISRFANTQNRISEADFFASHSFHLEMEKISRRLTAPPKDGALNASRWFYERARGQYKDAQAYIRDSERKRFQLRYPKDQLIIKTDVSKYELTFDCKPFLVSQGAQKAFLAFANEISIRWEKDAKEFGEGYFKDLMSKAIVFRWTDRMIGTSEWYRSDRGYKAQIVTYTVAWVVNQVRQNLNAELNLREIWARQSVPEALALVLSNAAPRVAAVIKDAPESVRNISEYAKRSDCWVAVQSKVVLTLPDNIGRHVIDWSKAKQIRNDDRATKKIDDDIDFDMQLLNLIPHLDEIKEAANRNSILSPIGSKAIGKLSSGKFQLTKSEKKVIRELLSNLDAVGVELPKI